MKGLVWLRTDLRMDDNPALKNAFIECDEVVCLYFYSPKQLSKHNEANVKVDFLKRNLLDLQSNYFSLTHMLLAIITQLLQNCCILLISMNH